MHSRQRVLGVCYLFADEYPAALKHNEKRYFGLKDTSKCTSYNGHGRFEHSILDIVTTKAGRLDHSLHALEVSS